MPNLTVRLPYDLYKRIKERRDVNWAEVVRRAIVSYLDQPLISDKLDEYIWNMVKNGEWEKLKYLYLKAELLAEKYGWSYAKRNLEILYPGKADEISSKVDNELVRLGINPRLSGYGPNNKTISEVVKDYMIMHGVYEHFEEECREKLSSANWKVREAAMILSQYESANIPLNGYSRTLKIYFGSDDSYVQDIINELVKIGIVYRDYYDSRAYSYPFLRIPEYALDILKELEREIYINPSYYQTEEFISFLRWMKGSTKYIVEYEEEEIIKEELLKEKINIDFKKFLEIRDKLIREKILIIDYSPHRRRAGRRSSYPAEWIYKITPVAKNNIIDYLLRKCLS